MIARLQKLSFGQVVRSDGPESHFSKRGTPTMGGIMPEVLDVLWLPGVGKKNRPAGLLRVLCLPGQRDCVENAVLRHTHTLGLREQTLDRVVAPRRAVSVDMRVS